MKKTDLVLFDKKKVKDVITQFGFKVAKEGNKEVVVGDDKKPLQCPTCEKELIVKKVGTAVHGSRLLFCDNPLCFSTWIAENKLE